MQNHQCLCGFERCREKSRRGQVDSSPVAGTTLESPRKSPFSLENLVFSGFFAGFFLRLFAVNFGQLLPLGRAPEGTGRHRKAPAFSPVSIETKKTHEPTEYRPRLNYPCPCRIIRPSGAAGWRARWNRPCLAVLRDTQNGERGTGPGHGGPGPEGTEGTKGTGRGQPRTIPGNPHWEPDNAGRLGGSPGLW